MRTVTAVAGLVLPSLFALALLPVSSGCGGRVGGSGGGSVGGSDGGVSPCAVATTPTLVVAGEGGAEIDVSAGTLLAVFNDNATSPSTGSVSRVDLANGATRVLASGRSQPYAVSASGGFAYWLDTGVPGSPTGITLMRAPLDGSAGAETVKVVNSGPVGYAHETLGAGDTLYFGDTGALESLASGATAPTVLVPNANPLSIAAAGGNVYWTSCGPGVNRIPAGGGIRQHVADSTCPVGLATDGVEVYFVDYSSGGGSGGGLFHAPADGGTAALLEGAMAPRGQGLALDAHNVYYTTAGGLYRTSRTGGVTQLVAAGTVTDVAVDDTCVYWGDAAAKAVFALRK